jgi:hypothetical protein
MTHAALIDRKKVLKHHPDKKAGSGDTNDDALFKCIQKGDPSFTSRGELTLIRFLPFSI